MTITTESLLYELMNVVWMILKEVTEYFVLHVYNLFDHFVQYIYNITHIVLNDFRHSNIVLLIICMHACITVIYI